MKRDLSLPSTFLAIWALTLLLFSPSASAQTTGQVIFGVDNWLAAMTGTVVCEEYESLIDIDGDPIQLGMGNVSIELFPSQSISLGQLSFEDDFELFQNTPPFLIFRSPLEDPKPLVLDLDPDLGKVEGLSLQTGILRVSLFDGDTLLENFVPLANDPDPNSDQIFNWINTQGLNITRIEFSAPEPGDLPDGTEILEAGGLVGPIKASFLPCPEEPETCFDQLDDVKAEVEALLATATGKDARRLQNALDCICWSQHDCFWVQPSGDRLTGYGSNVFLAGAYAICYLERVSDPQADVIIDQYLAALECLVDKEIEYAIANGGTQCYIDQAIDYADLAEVIDDEFDNQVVASLAYRLAWLNAYYSTY